MMNWAKKRSFIFSVLSGFRFRIALLFESSDFIPHFFKIYIRANQFVAINAKWHFERFFLQQSSFDFYSILSLCVLIIFSQHTMRLSSKKQLAFINQKIVVSICFLNFGRHINETAEFCFETISAGHCAA